MITRDRTARGAMLALAAAGMLTLAPARAQSPAGGAPDFPSRPVRLIVPYAPGGAADVLGRMIGQKLAERWGQQVLVDNRPGAGGGIGAQAGAKAPADGYTLTVTPVGIMAVNPWVYAKLPYDPQRDFQPVTLIASSPFVLAVNPKLPVTTLREFIEHARANPGKLSVGNPGSGTGQHLGGEYLASSAGIRLVHVPYKGSAPATTDLLGGVIDAQFDLITLLPHVKAGKLRALGVSSSRRMAALPEVPTLAEAGLPGFSVVAWNGVVAPAGTPMPVVEKIQKDIAQALAQRDVQDSLAAQGYEPGGQSPAEFAAFIRAELDKYGRIVKSAGIRAE